MKIKLMIILCFSFLFCSCAQHHIRKYEAIKGDVIYDGKEYHKILSEFKVEKEHLVNLKNLGISEETFENLKLLGDQSFVSQKEFMAEVRKIIGKDEIIRNNLLILKPTRILSAPDVMMYVDVGALPLIANVYDYSEHVQELSTTKYCFYFLFVSEKEESHVKLALDDIVLFFENGDSTDLKPFINETWVDFIEKDESIFSLFYKENFRDFYLAKNGIKKNFWDVSPRIDRKGDPIQTATDYYSDEYGIEIPSNNQEIRLKIILKIDREGKIANKEFDITLKLKDEIQTRAMFY